MNRTITTTSITRRRRSLRHAALALCAVLVALVAASCTADALDGTDTGTPSGNGNPDADVLTFAVGPRPGFTEVATTRADGFSVQEIAGQARNDRESAGNSAVIPGTKAVIPDNSTVIPGLTRDLPNQSTAPATRAELTDDGTHWETGDILWLAVQFLQDKQDVNTFDTRYASALKYDGTEWRYLTEAEAKDLNTGNLPGFTRLLRWPRESKDWPAPVMFIYAYYAGSGKPDADGTLTINPTGEIPTTPLIAARSGICSPDVQPVPLKFMYESISRVRIPAGCKVELTNAEYWSTISFSIDKGSSLTPEQITEIPAQSKDTDVFVSLINTPTAKLTRDGVSPCTFTFPRITDAEGYSTRNGVSYTLTPYTSGTQTPVADYDLTVATEDDLRYLAQAVNADEKLPNGKPFAEARVLQTENIELTKEWVHIGTRDNPFRGAYNGNGHEITGLTIRTTTNYKGISYAGLFGYAEGAVLTGIKLRKVKINIPQGSGANLYAGSIAGYIENSTLSLCTADGTVNTDGGDAEVIVGGIAGYSYGSTISRCRADVETKAFATYAYAGGIAGWNGVCNFILSCETRDRAVTAEGDDYAYAGGIAGYSSSYTFIAFCRTGANTVMALNGTVYNFAGGLVGHNFGDLSSCYSRATAKATGTGRNQAGVIVGNNPTGGDVQHCYGAGAADQGTSNLGGDPVLGIVYNANPDPGDIFGVMTNYPGKVESLNYRGKTYYPFTTTYTPSATPAYGIIPQRAVWKSDGAWNIGDGKYPELNIEAYEGRK